MKISRIKETCIYVTDLAKSRVFYQDKLGLELITIAEGKHIFFRAGQSVLLCFIATHSLTQTDLPLHGATGIIHFAFEVEKDYYDTALKKVRNCGITILNEKAWKNGLHSFYFNDPDNNLVEIIQEGFWETSF